MAAAAVKTRQGPQAPAAKVPPAEAIDRAHLARMTFGERSLERELLQLFDRQAAMLTERMHGSGDAAAIGALAHTLKGSASGIGATGVAHAAEAVERAVSASDRVVAIGALAKAVDAARLAIAEMLGTGQGPSAGGAVAG